MIFLRAVLLQLLFWHPFQFQRGRIEHLSLEGSLLGPFIEGKRCYFVSISCFTWNCASSWLFALFFHFLCGFLQLFSISVFGMDSIFSHSYFLIQHSLRNKLTGFAQNVKWQNTESSTNSIIKHDINVRADLTEVYAKNTVNWEQIIGKKKVYK